MRGVIRTANDVTVPTSIQLVVDPIGSLFRYLKQKKVWLQRKR